MTIGTNTFKQKLEEEKKKLEEELATVGRINPSNPADWEAVEPKLNTDTAEEGETAEGIEEYEKNTAILKELEIRYNNVLEALKKIEEGKYGICEVGGEMIEEDRLEANPAATTCKLHMNSSTA